MASALLEFTSRRARITDSLFPGVRENRRQEIYGAAFAGITRIVAEAPNPQRQSYQPYTEIETFTHVPTPRGNRLLIGTTTPKGIETPTDVFVRGILPKAVVIIALDNATGKYQVTASDHFGNSVPPSAKQIRKRLSFLEWFQHPERSAKTQPAI